MCERLENGIILLILKQINPKGVIQNWLINRNTIEFLEIWELIHNLNFKGIEAIKKEVGLNK